jgi:hypothetical protein
MALLVQEQDTQRESTLILLVGQGKVSQSVALSELRSALSANNGAASRARFHGSCGDLFR